MQANWSLILNVLLLIGVVVAIGRLMKARRQQLAPVNYQPSLGKSEAKPFDEIISIRKVATEEETTADDVAEKISVKSLDNKVPSIGEAIKDEKKNTKRSGANKSLMIFLLAKENRQLAGYELLQTVLAAGLRFGEGQLFHRHQHANGQGPVLCSLAAATPSGVFDLQNIGAFSVRGLCLFMQASGNPTVDEERLSIMYETAKQLSDGLDTFLLDDQKKPLTAGGLARYRRALNIEVNDSALA